MITDRKVPKKILINGAWLLLYEQAHTRSKGTHSYTEQRFLKTKTTMKHTQRKKKKVSHVP